MTRHSSPDGNAARASSADPKDCCTSFHANERGCHTCTLKYDSNRALPLDLMHQNIAHRPRGIYRSET